MDSSAIELAMDPGGVQEAAAGAGPRARRGRTAGPRQPRRSATDPGCRFASKGTSGSGAIPGYTVNALMENRHGILLEIGVEIFRSSASETEGCKALLRRARRRFGYAPSSLGGDKGFFSEGFLEHLLALGIERHIAIDRGRRRAHTRVRMRVRGRGYQLSQRCRKKDRGALPDFVAVRGEFRPATAGLPTPAIDFAIQFQVLPNGLLVSGKRNPYPSLEMSLEHGGRMNQFFEDPESTLPFDAGAFNLIDEFGGFEFFQRFVPLE